jgi:hypothetical protein
VLAQSQLIAFLSPRADARKSYRYPPQLYEEVISTVFGLKRTEYFAFQQILGPSHEHGCPPKVATGALGKTHGGKPGRYELLLLCIIGISPFVDDAPSVQSPLPMPNSEVKATRAH